MPHDKTRFRFREKPFTLPEICSRKPCKRLFFHSLYLLNSLKSETLINVDYVF